MQLPSAVVDQPTESGDDVEDCEQTDYEAKFRGSHLAVSFEACPGIVLCGHEREEGDNNETEYYGQAMPAHFGFPSGCANSRKSGQGYAWWLRVQDMVSWSACSSE